MARIFNITIPLQRSNNRTFWWRVGTAYLDEEKSPPQLNIQLNSKTLMQDKYLAFEQQENNNEPKRQDRGRITNAPTDEDYDAFDDIPF